MAKAPDPDIGLVGIVVLAVRYGPNEATISMPLKPSVTFEKLAEVDWPPRLLELGKALVRIAELRGSISLRGPQPS